MTRWRSVFTKQAQKDAKRIASAGLRSKVESLIAILAKNPFQNPPPYEKLVTSGASLRSIN